MSGPAADDRQPGPVALSGGRSGSRPAVWVAVGPGGSGTAVRFGVEEALRLHAPLHLVHVTRVPGPARPAARRPSEHPALQTAVRRARALAAGGVEVSAETRPGADVAETLTAARGPGLLVVGRRRSGWARLWTGGATTDRLLGQTDLPVAVVPDHGSVRSHPDVLVGLQDVVEAPGLLHAAAVEATARAGRLRVVHCWWRGDDDVAGPDVERAVTARAESLFGPVLQSLDLTAAVPSTFEVHHGPPHRVLTPLSRDAGLVVVGRHHHPWPSVSHLGPTTRRLLDQLGSPVLVVPATAPDRARGTHERAER